jgi:branched-chain amino acid transport system permease protein
VSELVQHLVNWLALGSIYALLALGIAVVFSVLGLINFAHGELVIVAGYSMIGLASLGVPWVAIIPLSILAATLAAVLMERIAFRPLRGAPVATTLLASLAVSIVLQNVFLLFLGGKSKPIPFPEWTRDTFEVGGVVIRLIDVMTLGTTAVVLYFVVTFLRKSVTGIALRAAADKFQATRLMGIPANRLVGGAFALSGLLAGVSAFFYLATASLVAPTTGFTPVLKGFVAAVIGGLGSLQGAVAGGFLLAGLEVFFQATLPKDLAPFIDAFVFGIVIAVLLFRPHGLSADRAALAERV